MSPSADQVQRRADNRAYGRANSARERAHLDAIDHKCTACEKDCDAKFICLLCGEERRVCSHLVGGFEERRPICDTCHDLVSLPASVLERWTRKDYAR